MNIVYKHTLLACLVLIVLAADLQNVHNTTVSLCVLFHIHTCKAETQTTVKLLSVTRSSCSRQKEAKCN